MLFLNQLDGSSANWCANHEGDFLYYHSGVLRCAELVCTGTGMLFHFTNLSDLYVLYA
jgi:hypothetical protein